ncbi:MAG: AMP-binding protein [Caldilineaceae bacterium]
MAFETLTSASLTWTVKPNLDDYMAVRDHFHWDEVWRELDGLPGGRGLNIAHEAVDRHADGPRRDHLALRWLGRDDEIRDFTYADLQAQTNRFANVIRSLGAGKTDRIFVLAGRIPELYIAALGTLKNTSVFCPLFSAFGPEPVHQRIVRGDGKILLTTERQYRQKIGTPARRPAHVGADPDHRHRRRSGRRRARRRG